MKRLLVALAIVVLLSWTCVAQTNAADAPASKEDVQRYLDAVHSRDLTKKMMAAMVPAMHGLMHDEYLKHKDELPADYESKMTAMVDDMFASMPFDEMIEAMAPVYQKHFTKGDIDSLVAFYTSPTGSKILNEMPAIMAEAMQNMRPIMSKYMDTMQERIKKETETMIAESKKKSSGKAPVHN